MLTSTGASRDIRGGDDKMTNHPNRSKHVVKGVARRAFPGDTAYIMQMAHLDEDGRSWPKGASYVPMRGGYDNAANADYQTISIDGVVVRFFERQEDGPTEMRQRMREFSRQRHRFSPQ
jgi:hypothetical protein